MFYNDRYPKPPTPRVATPTPEELQAAENARLLAEEAALRAELGLDIEDVGAAESAAELEQPIVEEIPQEPIKQPTPPPPPPFEYDKDLPPEGAEVPYVKNFEAVVLAVINEEAAEANADSKPSDAASSDTGTDLKPADDATATV